MDGENTLTFEDVLAWKHCPKGALHGYTPAWPLGDEELGLDVLHDLLNGNNTGALASIVNDRKDAVEWFLTTKLSMLQSDQINSTYPPRAEGKGHWSKRDRKHAGRYYVDLLRGETTVEFSIPYLYRPQGVYEAVYLDTNQQPMELHQWSDFVMMVGFHKEMFRLMSGEPLYARYLAPAHRTERQIEIPNVEVEGLLNLVSLSAVTNTIRPGYHCESTKKEGKTVTYRCPLRESGRCNPLKGTFAQS